MQIDEPLGVLQDRFVEVPAVYVQGASLGLHCCRYRGFA